MDNFFILKSFHLHTPLDKNIIPLLGWYHIRDKLVIILPNTPISYRQLVYILGLVQYLPHIPILQVINQSSHLPHQRRGRVIYDQHIPQVGEEVSTGRWSGKLISEWDVCSHLHPFLLSVPSNTKVEVTPSFAFLMTPAGFEPAIFTLKEWCPRPLDDGAVLFLSLPLVSKNSF